MNITVHVEIEGQLGDPRERLRERRSTKKEKNVFFFFFQKQEPDVNKEMSAAGG